MCTPVDIFIYIYIYTRSHIYIHIYILTETLFIFFINIYTSITLRSMSSNNNKRYHLCCHCYWYILVPNSIDPFKGRPERSSFGQNPGNYSNHVSQTCLPSKSSKQVFHASAWVEDLLERIAWKTCLVWLEDLLGVLGRLAWKSSKQVFQPSTAGPFTERAGGPSVPGEFIFIYIYIYLFVVNCFALVGAGGIDSSQQPPCRRTIVPTHRQGSAWGLYKAQGPRVLWRW